MPNKRENVLIWASDIEEDTIQQAMKASRLPFVEGHLALMPDAHVGIGSTVGSVIPTKGAIIPAAIGVDIGCGMAAVKFDMTADQLPDNLELFMSDLERAIPAGVGQGHDISAVDTPDIEKTMGWTARIQQQKLQGMALSQCGTLGSGNHFFEICLDESDGVWIVLHSGSRGIGNKLATYHINNAKGLMKERFINLEDSALAYLVEGDASFMEYIEDMRWSQDYAFLNRETMLTRAVTAFLSFLMKNGGFAPRELDRINCHHNFTQRENHHGKNLWITRKGAIKAGKADRGIIPGSMGTRSYIIRGLGNPASYNSCSHGAGRRMSRSAAKAQFTREDLEKAMEGKIWNSNTGTSLVDEIPASYKDIDQVMEDQKDLAVIEHTLRQILNYKGTK